MTNISLNLVAAARNQPQRTALRCDDVRLSYADFDSAAARVATFLDRAGIAPGDRVGIMLPNTPAFAVVFYGIMRRGAIAVPMNPLLKSREVEFYLSNTGARALFGTPAFAQPATDGAAAAGAGCWLVDDASLAELIADLPEQDAPVDRDDTDTAVVLHTSGTTGKPKGAELTHGGLCRNAEVGVRTLLEIGPDDVVITETPREGWAVATDAGETLALDLALTPDLVRRGLAREVVRQVQEGRKAAGLEVSDRIELWLNADAPELAAALDAHGGELAGEVLAVTVHRDGQPNDAWAGRDDDLGLTFGLRRV